MGSALGLWMPQEGGISVGQKAQIHVRNAFFGTTRVKDRETNQLVDRVELVLEVDAKPEVPSWVTHLTVGSGWTIVDGGRRIQWGGADGSTPSFMSSSRYGEWLGAVVKAEEEWVKQRLAAGLSPDTAAAWVGTDWLLEGVDTGRERSDGKGNLVHMLPTKLLSAGTAAPPAGAAPAAGAPPAAGGTPDAKLMQLAKDHADHSSWFKAAMADAAIRQWATDNAKINDMLDPTKVYDLLRAS